MRKSLILAFLLLILSAAVIGGAYDLVDQSKETVEIGETVLVGDRAEAAGITATSRTTLDDRLFWSTAWDAGSEPQPQTEFRFSRARRGDMRDAEPSANLYFHTDFGISGNAIDLYKDEFAWELPVEPAIGVAERTAAGETRREVVLIKDYYDYYPLFLDFHSGRGPREGGPEERRAMCEAVTQYFQVPVDERQKQEITVSKDDNGNIVEVDCNSVSGETAEEFTVSKYRDGTVTDSGKSTAAEETNLITDAVVTEQGCYFLIQINDKDGRRAAGDWNNAGIHYMPFEASDTFLISAVERLRLIYPLDDGVTARDIAKSGDGKSLLLFTEEDGAQMLTVLDMESLETRQRLVLLQEGAGLSVWDVRIYEDFMVVPYSDDRFVLLTGGDNGYTLRMQGRFDGCGEIESGLPYGAALAYDGERLAIMYLADWYDSCRSYLLVYREQGPVFAARYDHSFDRTLAENYDQKVRPREVEPLRITFE